MAVLHTMVLDKSETSKEMKKQKNKLSKLYVWNFFRFVNKIPMYLMNIRIK